MRLAKLLLPALLLSLAEPSSAETLRVDAGGAAAVIELSDRLGAHPQLAAFLKADALAFAEDAGFEGARSFRLTDRATWVDAGYASVLRHTETDYGGAAPNVLVEALTWGAATGDFVRLDAFFDQGETRDEALIAISRHLRETIRKRLWGGRVALAYAPLVSQATNPDPAVLSNFTLEPGGALAFHFSPKEVAPYARGVVSILTPRTVFAPWLNGAGRATLR